MNNQADNPSRESPAKVYPTRWQLFRDVLAFQFKLALDGLRDLLLSPISITAALIGVFSSRENPGKLFYRLLEIGGDTDRWINLFGTHQDEHAPSSDDLVRRAESVVQSQYEKGGMVTNLKHQTDNVLNKIQEKHSPGGGDLPKD